MSVTYTFTVPLGKIAAVKLEKLKTDPLVVLHLEAGRLDLRADDVETIEALCDVDVDIAEAVNAAQEAWILAFRQIHDGRSWSRWPDVKAALERAGARRIKVLR